MSVLHNVCKAAALAGCLILGQARRACGLGRKGQDAVHDLWLSSVMERWAGCNAGPASRTKSAAYEAL